MVKLFRPIGVQEYRLIKDLSFKAFPPRLAWQPIFYPVLNQEYAEQIARDWNTKDEFSGYCGLVTRFAVKDAIAKNYDVKEVGGAIHKELWVPAEELAAFNAAIIGEIEVVNAFFGKDFKRSLHPELEHYHTIHN